MKRVLVIGGGSIGERHTRCFQNTGRADVCLCELNDDVRSRVTETYSLNASFKTLDEALAAHSGEPFAASIVCTPAHLHIPMARQLAEVGIGLLIEKPLSTSEDGVDELRSLVEDKSLALSVAYVMRHQPAFVALKVELDAGRFGRPVQLVYTGGQHFPFYRPAYREIYYTKRETGGGAIQDGLTHTMNMAEWLLGPIARLVCDAEHLVLEGVDVEDTVHVMTRQAQPDGNILGSFSLNQHQPPNESRMTVLCENGALRVEGLRLLTCTEPDSDWTVEQEFKLERDDLFVAQAIAFLDQLEGKAEAACSLDEALQTLRVNLAELRSLETQQWETP
jgi:predicted dehydrogenase